MSVKLGILMDPIASINSRVDTSFAMLLAAQARQWDLYYMEPADIWLQDGLTWGRMRSLTVKDDISQWFRWGETRSQPLVELDLLLMRKDPPFTLDYIYLTYLLEHAEEKGLLVINKPSSLRDANEKLFATWFPQCCPKTLVTAQMELLKEFAENEEDIIIKPLGGRAGQSIFHVTKTDTNLPVILEMMTSRGTQCVMAQRFIPNIIREGDKRILLVNGEPVPYALARIPAHGDFRGNLGAGARGEGRELSDRDRWICDQVGPTLRDKGLWFVGLDVIGDYLTEINVTSPTGARQLDTQFGLDIAGDLLDFAEGKIGNES
ncbi:MAG: glutathione synthase [Gammaproteobacteria bacterium RIFCSPHIGHO2_12_FULL_41_15]|nr:MAG: glutathione synthase [Gammaproteobacteria bacterium RIFCSPHIGHO2_12_FULL_41_15]